MSYDVERLIETITEEIYARLSSGDARPRPAMASEGLEIDHLICPGCTGRCPATCAGKTQRIVNAGASRVSVTAPVPARMAGDPALAAMIDHTLLKPEARREDIIQLCDEARRYGFASVCINPCWVSLAARELRGSRVMVCTVAGFPLGATTPAVKRCEAAEAVQAGAQEIDMVINVGALRSEDYGLAGEDIRGVAQAAHAGGAILKVILETALLDDKQKVAGCLLAQSAGADFVKTSTGFGPGGATVHDVELMRFVVGDRMGVKAAGGVRTLDDLKKMVSAGATRIGASASVKIMEEAGNQVPGIRFQVAGSRH
jgi:deoxyribose-phosphate aldolase